jgi:hypothetical protein
MPPRWRSEQSPSGSSRACSTPCQQRAQLSWSACPASSRPTPPHTRRPTWYETCAIRPAAWASSLLHRSHAVLPHLLPVPADSPLAVDLGPGRHGPGSRRRPAGPFPVHRCAVQHAGTAQPPHCRAGDGPGGVADREGVQHESEGEGADGGGGAASSLISRHESTAAGGRSEVPARQRGAQTTLVRSRGRRHGRR